MSIFAIFTTALTILDAANAAALINNGNKDSIIPNSYIVVMKKGISSSNFDSHVSWASKVHSTSAAKGSSNAEGLRLYNINDWKGYSGSFDDTTLNELLGNEAVDYVEPNRVVRVSWTTQKDAPSWGLGRISHQKAGNADFVYDDSAGEGITIYGVDSGIDIDHPDFKDRVSWGFNSVNSNDADGAGHGTHTAGTFAGTQYGIAKKAKIIAVKVLNEFGSGDSTAVIGGIEWAVSHARENNLLGKAVMNLSLGTDKTQAINDAATNALEAGIFLAAAAGNSDASSTSPKGISPASAEGVCTVAASDEQDNKWFASNFGPAIDIYAPGSNIVSAIPGGKTQVNSGTSMAAPHVAGVAAILMASEGLEPNAVCDRIKELAQPLVMYPGTNTTNKLLYNGSGQ